MHSVIEKSRIKVLAAQEAISGLSEEGSQSAFRQVTRKIQKIPRMLRQFSDVYPYNAQSGVATVSSLFLLISTAGEHRRSIARRTASRGARGRKGDAGGLREGSWFKMRRGELCGARTAEREAASRPQNGSRRSGTGRRARGAALFWNKPDERRNAGRGAERGAGRGAWIAEAGLGCHAIRNRQTQDARQ